MTAKPATVGPMTPSAPPRSGGRPRSPAADQAILDTTMRLLAEQGYDAMSIEGIAAAAGVGKTTIYRRYPNKRDLVVAALASVAATLPEPSDSGDTRTDVLALIADTLEVLRRTGVGFSMAGTLLVKERDEPMLLALFRDRVIRPRFELGVRILRRGIERGELRPDINPEVVLPTLVGSTFARHIAGFSEDEAWLASMIDTVWEGIGAR
jgi:AcrR family transcriptional regulator